MTLIYQYEYLLMGVSQSELQGTEGNKLGRVEENFCHMCCECVIPGQTKESFKGQCLHIWNRFCF